MYITKLHIKEYISTLYGFKKKDTRGYKHRPKMDCRPEDTNTETLGYDMNLIPVPCIDKIV